MYTCFSALDVFIAHLLQSRWHKYRNEDFSSKSLEADIFSHCLFSVKPGMDCCRLGFIDKVHVKALPRGSDCVLTSELCSQVM